MDKIHKHNFILLFIKNLNKKEIYYYHNYRLNKEKIDLVIEQEKQNNHFQYIKTILNNVHDLFFIKKEEEKKINKQLKKMMELTIII